VLKIQHGVSTFYTPYRVVQHDHVDVGLQFIEVLEIPPGEIILHEYNPRTGSSFSEWDTLDHAKQAFCARPSGGQKDGYRFFPKLSGFIRLVECGESLPWFYTRRKDRVVESVL